MINRYQLSHWQGDCGPSKFMSLWRERNICEVWGMQTVCAVESDITWPDQKLKKLLCSKYQSGDWLLPFFSFFFKYFSGYGVWIKNKNTIVIVIIIQKGWQRLWLDIATLSLVMWNQIWITIHLLDNQQRWLMFLGNYGLVLDLTAFSNNRSNKLPSGRMLSMRKCQESSVICIPILPILAEINYLMTPFC